MTTLPLTPDQEAELRAALVSGARLGIWSYEDGIRGVIARLLATVDAARAAVPDTDAGLRSALRAIEGRLTGRIPYDDLSAYRDELLDIARAALQPIQGEPEPPR